MISPLLTPAMLGEIETTADTDAWNIRATRMVESACMNDIYTMDADTGWPSDEGVLDAMQRAALEQCKWWASAGVDPTLGIAGLSVFNIAKSSIGGASIEGNSSLASAQDKARVTSLSCLVMDAVQILWLSGLASSQATNWW